jgi:hypothetical protein
MSSLPLSGFLTTALIHGGVLAALVLFPDWDASSDAQPRITEMISIEAALAYKSEAQPTKQPQKPRRAPPPVPVPETKPEGVSRDEQKAPVVEKKPDLPPEPKKEPKEPDFAKEFEKYRQMRQSDDDDALPSTDLPQPGGGGAFDGSKHGFAEANRGDPYLRDLAGEVYQEWEMPTLETGKGAAVGCIRLGKDGRILETKLEQKSGNTNLDRSVGVALQKLEKLRESDSKPVPRHLMDATTQWICFKFSVS